LAGIGLGCAFFSLLLSPKVAYHTGLTEKDLLDDFLTQQLFPFVNDKIKKVGPIDEFKPGKLHEKGVKHPVYLIPGFVTTGLELWEGKECADKYFRERLWGSTSTAQAFLSDRDCWATHLRLDAETGLDPENIRLRAAQGFGAADYFIGNYWVWSKIIENLALVGYGPNNMYMFGYDWRLSPRRLQERDNYFTLLKSSIENSVKQHGEKVVLISHSMGGNTMIWFMNWVEADRKIGGGGGGGVWVDKHIKSFVNVAGPLLGTSKALSAMLTGDTSDMSPFEPMLEQVFGRVKRMELFTSWGSIYNLVCKGGNKIWGNDPAITFTDYGGDGDGNGDDSTANAADATADAADATADAADATADAAEDNIFTKFSNSAHRTTDEMVNFLSEWGGGFGENITKDLGYSFNVEVVKKGFFSFEQPNDELWHNPLMTKLPAASDMTIHCLYGVGRETEESYFYKRNPVEKERVDVPFSVDTSVSDKKNGVTSGIKYGDGDSTVPLVSLGYMCRGGWLTPDFNPSGVKVVTREYKDFGNFKMLDPFREGPNSGHHVDIMGNVDLIQDILYVVTGEEDKLKDRILSNIDTIVGDIRKRL